MRKRTPAGNHLVEDEAERKDVGPRVGRQPAHLFRRHVADGPHDRADGSDRTGDIGRRGHLPREAEIENLDATVARDEEVLGLDVSMDDALFVGCCETARDLHGECDGAANRKGATREPAPQGLPLEQLHDCVRRPVRVAKLVNPQDVRMR